MRYSAKHRPFLLHQILNKRTDEEHSLSTTEIIGILQDEFGLRSHRQTIYDDIRVLQELGVDIICERHKENHYRIVNRQFETSELKILIDAVESSKFITQKKSQTIVGKIVGLASGYEADLLKRNLLVDGRIKQDKESVLYTVDAINQAINEKKKISFTMDDYDLQCRRVPHRDGEVYVFSPYTLVWDGDFYYVVGWSEKYEKIVSHRVDRISHDPQILEETAHQIPKDFDANRYINSMFRMYDAPRRRVSLICENSVINSIVDKFGKKALLTPVDEDHFRLEQEITVGSVFYGWIFGFGGKVQIERPRDVREAYREMVEKAGV